MTMKDDSTANLNFTLYREGNISVYGNLIILYSGPQGKSYVLKELNGISVFTPNLLRRFSIDITKPSDIDFNKGKIIVRYNSANDAKPEVFSTKELLLGE
jgi:hypothetical protein